MINGLPKIVMDNGEGITKKVEGCRYHTVIGGKEVHFTISDAFAYEFLLLGIVILTGLFAWKYMKREFTIIFLILLGPISCITYPIDKISDGKAQAFNRWLTEFAYNVLVQPFHLLLYVVLVGSAVELADRNVLYGLACLAMLIPAEKFVKEMFGFKNKLGGGPLSAAATGAVASQLMNRVRGGGSGKSGGQDNNSNNSTPTRLNDKTVQNDAITGENNTNIQQGNTTDRDGNEAPQLASGTDNGESDDTGNSGSASAAAAFQDSEDPVADAERERLEEKEAEGEDLTDEERKWLDEHQQQGNEQGLENSGGNENSNNETEAPKRNLKTKAVGTVKKIAAIHSQRMAKKWGSTNRKQRWINRGKKIGTTALKTTGRLAGGVAGGIVGASVGLLSGKGIAAGAYMGATLTNRAMNKVGGVAGDYVRGLRTPEQTEKAALKDFKGDKAQQDKAILNFRNKHEGQEPTNNQLDQEMEDRFELARYGLTDTQINETLGTYQKLKDPNGEYKYTKDQALNQAVLASQLADRYRGKFEKESDMKGALTALTQRLGGNEDKAREILGQAANMKEETVQLPPRQIPESLVQQTLRARGVNKPTEQQIKQEEDLHVRLQDAGFDDKQIQQLSALTDEGEDFTTIVDKAYKIHADWSKGKTPNIDGIIGKNATTKQANQEIIERLEVEKEFNIKGKDADLKVDAIRAFEKAGKVKKEQRKIGAKSVKLELSQNDKNAMTDKDKTLTAKYEELSKASKTDLETYITNLNSN